MKNLFSVAVALMLLLQFSCAKRDTNTAGNTDTPEVITETETDVAVTEDTDADADAMANTSGILVYVGEAQPSNLGQYKTYTWVNPIQGMGDKSFDNDPIHQQVIEQAVIQEFQDRGYTMVPDNSDLLVNYYILRKPMQLTGTNDADFADFRWNPNSLRAAGDTRVYDLDAGTLLVQLADRRTGQLVWQGYATGLTDGDVTTIDPERVKQAVALVFDKYTYEVNR